MLDYKDYIYAIYQYKSFSKAAKMLHVSQPWLSTAVKKTEMELQLSLFDRSTSPVSLTEAGRYYIEQIKKINSIEEEMRRAFEQMHERSGIPLRIGSSMYFCTYVLPSLLRDYQELHPETSLTFVEGHTGQLIKKMYDHELDLIIEVENIDDSRIVTLPWQSEELILAVPESCPINSELSEHCFSFDEFLQRGSGAQDKPPVSLSRFRDEGFILLNSENDLHQRSLSMCKNAGFEPKVNLMLSQLMTAYYLVCEGQGITFLRSTIPCHVAPTKSIVFYLIDDPLARRDTYVSYLKQDVTESSLNVIDFIMDRKNWNG